MDGPNLMENGKSPRERKFTGFQVVFYTFVFLLTIVSALVSIVFSLLHHKQASGFCWAHGTLAESSTQNSAILSWNWKLKNCNGFVQKDHDQFLIIEQTGTYFIYAQVNRIKETDKSFILTLLKDPDTTLDKVGGPKNGSDMTTLNFARPFFLNKGDRLHCKKNFDLDKILLGNQSYWGLFKM